MIGDFDWPLNASRGFVGARCWLLATEWKHIPAGYRFAASAGKQCVTDLKSVPQFFVDR